MTKLKKQIFTAVALVVVVAVLGTVYYLLTRQDDTPADTAVEYGRFGETMKNGRPFIVDEIPNEDMNSILVHNTYGEYCLIHKKSGAYKLEGLEGYEVNQTMLAQLRVNAMYLLAVSYVENAELENIEQYGINKENPENWFTVFYNDNKDSYTVLIGDKTPDGAGYYAMLEGREALYVIDTGVEYAILQPKKAYVTPKIVDAVEDTQVYTLKDFTLFKKGEKFIEIEKASGDLTYGNNATHRIVYPAYNYATNLTNFESMLSLLKNLSGTETLYYGEQITDELLAELGFFDAQGNDVSDYSMIYTYPAFSEYLYVMEDEETGDYIVYSLKENIITRVSAESLSFLKWEMLLWVSAEIYMLDIEDIESVVFEHKGQTASFSISGTGQDLSVIGNGIPVNTDSFKALYRSMMYVLVTSYTNEEEYGEEQLRMTVTTEKGEVLDYHFYAHTSTNSYYTLNGFGEFYVSAQKVIQMRADAFDIVEIQ